MINYTIRINRLKMTNQSLWVHNKDSVLKFLIDFTNNPGIITQRDAECFNELSYDIKKTLGIINNHRYDKYVYQTKDQFISVPYEEFDEEVYHFMLYRVTELLFMNYKQQHLYILVSDNEGCIFYLSNIKSVYDELIKTHAGQKQIVLDFIHL